MTREEIINGLRQLRSLQLGMDDLDVKEPHAWLDAAIAALSQPCAPAGPGEEWELSSGGMDADGDEWRVYRKRSAGGGPR